jgi:hypothetical protein
VIGEQEAAMASVLFILWHCVHPSLSLPLPGVDSKVTGEWESPMGSILFVLLPFFLHHLKGTGDKLRDLAIERAHGQSPPGQML